MYLNKTTMKWTLLGTVSGSGYDCKHDTVSTVEESTNGLWNKVASHTSWIEKTMEKLGEKLCRDT